MRDWREGRWFGIWRSSDYNDSYATRRNELSSCVETGTWSDLLSLLRADPSEGERMIWIPKLDDPAHDSLIHEVARVDTPPDVIAELVALGAWRNLVNGLDERPVDIARQRGNNALAAALEPVIVREVPATTLAAIESHFHTVILDRARDLVEDWQFWLPKLGPLMEDQTLHMWCPIYGMYGGFHFWLEGERENVRLISESWCRVVDGSGMRHEITRDGSRLVDEGFV